MTAKHHGYALLSAIVALVMGLSAAIYVTAAEHGPGHRRAGDAVAAGPGPYHAAPVSTGVWVGAWAAAPAGGEPGTAADGMAGRTVRNVVHTGVGGSAARVTLSNLYGDRPLRVTHATLAVAAHDDSPAADPDTLRRLTFEGASAVVVPAGGQTVSDTVAVTVPHDADVLVSVYSPTSAGPVTYHPRARQTSYVAEGQSTEDTSGAAFTETTPYWRYLTALDVLGDEADGTVVALGDSITDGITSTSGANRRWPDALADRLRATLAADGAAPRYAVVNAGISGNQLLADDPRRGASGLNRFERDVLGRPGVKAVVIDLGINDILRNKALADPQAIVAGLRTLADRAHAHGVEVVGATLTPFRGHHGYSAAREDVRQQVNRAIRTDGLFDDVVDFDKALRDPYDPRSLRPQYDSGDHLHPSDAGYRRMAQTLDLEKLSGSAPARL
ncbi:SGNH/GDSL hydrolase family protein [Streptomyces sp. IBSBF 2953]|uniref:SGNH/GDSL hydrolase family protein n=1 Tax=Streptomyces TaxID=1883 RepID=UPI00211A8732|nr:SGNH/GDSL hydrolase family protein [Streptomyces scabiei]MCQ9185298.1 SGNH/GDSL hydrolase family protein [Streptomyces hayashii]MDX3113488.1 SGNH/GDSL hydrolase family protein [Streptomyces scabiei]